MAETISIGARVDYSGGAGGPSYGGGGTISGSALDLFQINFGKKLSHVMISGRWQDNGVTHPFSTYQANCDILHAAGIMPFLEWVPLDLATPNNNFNLRLTQLSGGAYDSYITSFASAVKAWGKPVLIRLFTEENLTGQINTGYHYQYGDSSGSAPGNPPAVYGTNSWTNSMAQFQAAWRHIVGIWKNTVGCTNAKFVWCPNVRSATGASGAHTYVQMDGGNAALGLVDWLGFDGYTTRPSRPFSDVFQGTNSSGNADSYADMCSVHPTLPIMICETGWLGTMSTAHAATITSNGTQWTITTTAQPGGGNNETWLATNGITITGATPSGYNGQQTIASVSGTGPYTILVNNTTSLAASTAAQVQNVDRISRAAAVTQSGEIDLPAMDRIKGVTLFWKGYGADKWTLDWDGSASQAANIDFVALRAAFGNAHYLAGNQMGTTSTRDWVAFQNQPMVSPTERYRAICKSTS